MSEPTRNIINYTTQQYTTLSYTILHYTLSNCTTLQLYTANCSLLKQSGQTKNVPLSCVKIKKGLYISEVLTLHNNKQHYTILQYTTLEVRRRGKGDRGKNIGEGAAIQDYM